MALSVSAISLGLAYGFRGLYEKGLRLPGFARILTLAFVQPPILRAAIFAVIGLGALVFSLRMLSRAMLVPFLKGGDIAVKLLFVLVFFVVIRARVRTH